MAAGKISASWPPHGRLGSGIVVRAGKFSPLWPAHGRLGAVSGGGGGAVHVYPYVSGGYFPFLVLLCCLLS